MGIAVADSREGSLQKIHTSHDYLSHGDLLRAFSKSPHVEYRHANFLFSGGEWQGHKWDDLGVSNPPPRALVVGHSDTIVTEGVVQKIRDLAPINTIFASNLAADALILPGVFDLPLGIPNRDKTTKTHRVQSSRSVIHLGWVLSRQNAAQTFRGVFANFTPKNNRSVRPSIVELVSNHEHLQPGNFRVSRSGRLNDFRKIAYWGLNICPPGNGPDTHRVWETLLMGAFPVILKSDHVFRLLSSLSLPFVALDNWTELGNKKFLSERFESLKEQDWNYAPLTNSFWVDRITKPWPPRTENNVS